MVESLIWDYGSPDARRTEPEETREILSDIHCQIVRDSRRHIYSHKVCHHTGLKLHYGLEWIIGWPKLFVRGEKDRQTDHSVCLDYC